MDFGEWRKESTSKMWKWIWIKSDMKIQFFLENQGLFKIGIIHFHLHNYWLINSILYSVLVTKHSSTQDQLHICDTWFIYIQIWMADCSPTQKVSEDMYFCFLESPISCHSRPERSSTIPLEIDVYNEHSLFLIRVYWSRCNRNLRRCGASWSLWTSCQVLIWLVKGQYLVHWPNLSIYPLTFSFSV